MAGELLYYHFQDGSMLLVNADYADVIGDNGGQLMVRAPHFIKLFTEGHTDLFEPFDKYDLDGNHWVLDNQGILKINNTTVLNSGDSNLHLEYDESGVTPKLTLWGDSVGTPPILSMAEIEPKYRGDSPLRTASCGFIDAYNQYITIERFLSVANLNSFGYVRFCNAHKIFDDYNSFIYATLMTYGSAGWIGNGGTVWFVDREFTAHSSSGFTFDLNNISYTASLFNDTPPIIDPYDPGDDAPVGEGGGGPQDFQDVPIPRSSLPSISAAATGFTRLYNPSLQQLNDLANYMWTDNTFLQTLINQFAQLLENPMDYMIALNLVPCAVPNGADETFKLLFIPTNVQMPPVTNQFVDVDCGTVTVPEQFNSALDYAPYTKISCFLPYIGTVQLDTDEVMGKELHLWYRIDVFTGGCVADIVFDGGVRYEFTGQCAINVPFSSADFTGYISAMLQAAKSVASVAAGASGNAPLAAELAGMPEPKTSRTTGTVTTTNFDKDFNFKGTSVKETDMQRSSSQASFGSLVMQNVANTVGAVMTAKPVITRSGGFSGNTGYLGVRRPYLTIESPRLVNPKQYGKFNGYPSMKYLSLANLSGFTQIQQIQLNGFGATNPELDEMLSLLKSGVIF